MKLSELKSGYKGRIQGFEKPDLELKLRFRFPDAVLGR